MTHKRPRHTGSGRLLILALLGLLPVGAQSSSDLVNFLIRDREPEELLVFTCGETEEDRKDEAAAEALVKLGDAAIPVIEKALGWIEAQGRRGEFVPNSWLLLHTYAQIRERAALSRLQSMIDNPDLVFLENTLDDSVAVSLGLTSYVSRRSWTAPPISPPAFCVVQQPRQALDRLILAWEVNDRSSLESNLGPRAKEALSLLLNGRAWADMRAYLWRGRPGGDVAVGYRFEDWNVGSQILNPGEIDTQFRSRSGRDCAKSRVRFIATPFFEGFAHPANYLVDNADLGDLLRLVASCAIE